MYSQSNPSLKQLSYQLATDPSFAQRVFKPNTDTQAGLMLTNILDALAPMSRKQTNRSNESQPAATKCPNTELYKTELCRYWCAGLPCKFGVGCWFAHGPEELQIAQFVVPAKNPGFNSLDYEVRSSALPTVSSSTMLQKMQNLQLCDSTKLTKVIDMQTQGILANGSTFSIERKSPTIENTNEIPSLPISPFSKVVGYEREVKKISQYRKVEDTPFPFENFTDSGVSSSRRSSGGSTLASSERNLASPPFTNEIKSAGQSPVPLSPTDSFPQNKDIFEEGELCDMFKWCGMCIMGNACPYIHRY